MDVSIDSLHVVLYHSMEANFMLVEAEGSWTNDWLKTLHKITEHDVLLPAETNLSDSQRIAEHLSAQPVWNVN